MSRPFHAAFGRYLAVGGVATALHYVVLLGMVEFARLPAAPSAAFGGFCGALAAYRGNREFTFTAAAPHRRALPRFLAVAAAGALANGGAVWAGTELMDAHYLAVQALATVAIVCAGFVMNQRWTFA